MPRKPQFEDPVFDDQPSGGGAVPYQPPVVEPTGAVLRRHEAELMEIPGVRGVGETRNTIGDPAIMVYLTHQGANVRVPRQIDGVDVVTTVVGEVDAYSGRGWRRR